MAENWTSGPWAVSPFRAEVTCGTFGTDGDLLPVARMLWPTDERTEDETYANARLIAAAPLFADIASRAQYLANKRGGDYADLTKDELCDFMVEFDAALSRARGDVTKPLKDMLPDYRAIEKRIEAAVLERFAVPAPLHPLVKEADVVMLATEQRQLMCNRDEWDYTRGRKPLDLVLPCHDPDAAFGHFLARFDALAPPKVRARASLQGEGGGA